jgi:hypothetical protein
MTTLRGRPRALSFHADDMAELLRIFDITWIG